MDKSIEKLARLEDIILSAGAATWEWNVQTGELILNETWAKLLGYTLTELEPISIATFQAFTHPDDFKKTNAHFERVFANLDEVYQCDLRMRHKDGQFVGRLGYWTATPNVDELFWSPKIYIILGLDETTDRPSVELFRSLVHPDDLDLFDEKMIALVKGEEFDFEHRIIRPDDDIVWVHERATQTELSGHTMLIGTMQNITDRKTIENRLVELSQTDELTRIYNRRYLLASLREAIEKYGTHTNDSDSAVLALLDLDNFKAINDQYGHEAGDHVLQKLSKFLTEFVRSSDVVARTGGEEFVILMHNTNLHHALPLLENMLDGIRQLEFQFANQPLSISATIGVTEIQPEDNDTSDVLVRADRALYHGKNYGRDQIVTWDAIKKS